MVSQITLVAVIRLVCQNFPCYSERSGMYHESRLLAEPSHSRRIRTRRWYAFESSRPGCKILADCYWPKAAMQHR